MSSAIPISTERSASCQVCGVIEKSFNLNYGAATCLSCRAFFRRQVKLEGKRVFYCKKGNDKCQISEEHRSSCCKKCRFERCIQVGMRREAVLTETQIQVRFQKQFKKKRNVQGQVTENSVKNEEDDEDSDENDSSLERNIKTDMDGGQRIEIDEHRNDLALSNSRPNSPRFNTSRKLYSSKTNLCCTKRKFNHDLKKVSNESHWRRVKLEERPTSLQYFDQEEELLNYISKVQQSWTQSVAQHEPAEEFVHQLINVHNGCQGARNSLYQAMLRDHINVFLRNVFTTFAKNQPELNLIGPVSEQTTVIEQSYKLFIQYIIGRYASAKSGHEQLKWLLLGKTPDFIELITDLQEVSINDLNNDLDVLMLDGSLLLLYSKYAAKLNIENLELQASCGIALLCLFNCGFSEIVQKHLNFIYRAWIYAKKKLKMDCPDGPTLSHVINTIKVMIDITSIRSNVLTSSSDQMQIQVFNSNTVDNLAPYEECRQRFQSIKDKVSFGKESIEQFVSYNFGQPVSKHFFPHNLRIYSERCLLLIKNFSEFNQLSDGEQRWIYANNIYKAVAFAVATAESAKDGMEQMDKAFGTEDNKILSHILTTKGLSPDTQLRKISLAGQPEMISQMNEVTQNRYSNILTLLQDNLDLTLNSVTILLHILIFSGLDHFVHMSTLEQRFKKMLFNWLVYQEGTEAGRSKYDNCMRQMENILQLAAILKNISQN